MCENITNYNKRDSYFDNLKLFLIFTVILGHILERFPNNIYNYINAVIYAFHMPLFIFVSGYFSKDVEKGREKAFLDFFIPYLIFNTLCQMLGERTLLFNIFYPEGIYWYLFSMFLWKIIIKDVIRIKRYIIISFLLGLYIGIFDDANSFLALSRTIVFLPFFLLGYKANKEWIEAIKKIPKSLIIGILMIILVFIRYEFNVVGMPGEMLLAKDSYNILGLSNGIGMIYRLIQYSVAIVMGVCVLNLIPKREFKFTNYGRRTMPIYVGHAYIMYILALAQFFLEINPYMGVIIFIAISILIILILGNTYTYKMYNYGVNVCKKLLLSSKDI